MLYCPNPTCQTLNDEAHRFCQQCGAVLPRRYLWAMAMATPPAVDALVGDRYLHKGHGIFLDTLPGYPPATDIEDMPPIVLAHLRLAEHRLQVPLVYDLVVDDTYPPDAPLILLEEAAIWQPGQAFNPTEAAADTEPCFRGVLPLPSLLDLWTQVSGRRQLFWLWQLAALWQPLTHEGVGQTLLSPDLIRVEGALVRLSELRLNPTDTAPTLATLGALWQEWSQKADPEVAPLLDTLCQQMVEETLTDVQAVMATLEERLATAHQAMPHVVRVATQTDQGPTRSRNEDACYPASGTVQTESLYSDARNHALAIVCDGIGGHQGGDVASNLAIAALDEQLHALPLPTLDPSKLQQAITDSIELANDRISQRNDSEARLERQRMGTTLVMGLLRHHELYLAHVGDSRAYWITRWGCHQVTLDDDVASRQMRLGYVLYRQALRHPNSGSLVQALGMGASNLLHPTVQRLLLDEDGVILLCSDGLSDGDRVEEHWDTELLPLLHGQQDFSSLSQRLVEIANTLNGHDNVTVGLLHHQLPIATADQQVVWQHMQALAQHHQPAAASSGTPPASPAVIETAPTQVAAPTARRSLLPLLGLLLLLLLGSGLLVWLLPQWRDRLLAPFLGNAPPALPPVPTPVESPGALPTPDPILPGNLVQIGRTPDGATPLRLLSQPDPAKLEGLAIPPGTILRVLEKPAEIDRPWLRVIVCVVGDAPAPLDDAILDSTAPPPTIREATPATVRPAPIAQVGDEGWLAEADVVPLAMPVGEEVIPSEVCPRSPNPASDSDPSLEGDPLG